MQCIWKYGRDPEASIHQCRSVKFPPHIFSSVLTSVVVFASLGGDGQCLIWEVPAVPPTGADASTPIVPIAKLKESLGTGIAREDLAFDPEHNTLLVCLNERKIR